MTNLRALLLSLLAVVVLLPPPGAVASDDPHWLLLAWKLARTSHGAPYGAVLVENNAEIARGQNHWLPDGRHMHAEIACLSNAPRKDLSHSTIYVNAVPCDACAHAIVAHGIRHVVAGDFWTDARVVTWLQSQGVSIQVLHLEGQGRR